MQNHFELFGLPVQFAVNRTMLDEAYRKIQHLVHPDRFVTATETEKRAAMQWAATANDAYKTLRDPLRRAIYLCEINGYNVRKETHVSMDPDFLMQQMQWRETLEEARDSGDRHVLHALDEQRRQSREECLQCLETFLNQHQFEQAARETRKLMFLEKFGEEISRFADGPDSTN